MDSGLYETAWKAHENQAENWYWNSVPRPISTLCSPDPDTSLRSCNLMTSDQCPLTKKPECTHLSLTTNGVNCFIWCKHAPCCMCCKLIVCDGQGCERDSNIRDANHYAQCVIVTHFKGVYAITPANGHQGFKLRKFKSPGCQPLSAPISGPFQSRATLPPA